MKPMAKQMKFNRRELGHRSETITLDETARISAIYLTKKILTETFQRN